MVSPSLQTIAMHEVGHAVARIELERSDRVLLAPEPLTFVSVEPDETTLGRVHMPARVPSLNFFESHSQIRRFRAHRRRVAGTRALQTDLDRIAEADIIELLGGPIAEARLRLGRSPTDREISDLSDYVTSDTWLDDIAAGGAANDDLHRAQRWMVWLTDGRRVDASALAERIIRRAIDLLDVGSDRGFQRLSAMAAVLAERRSMDADAFTSAWARIVGGRA